VIVGEDVGEGREMGEEQVSERREAWLGKRREKAIKDEVVESG
jgi:hypothetical protein